MARGVGDLPELASALNTLQHKHHLTRLYLDMLNVIEAALSHVPTAWDCLRCYEQHLRERRSRALSSGTAIDALRQDLKYLHMDLDDQRECFWELDESLSEVTALSEQLRKSNQSCSTNLTQYNQSIQSIIQQQQAVHCQIDHRLLVLMGVRRRLKGFRAMYEQLMACQAGGDTAGHENGVNNTKSAGWMAQLMEQYRIHAVQYMEACKEYELQTELFNRAVGVGVELAEEEPGSVCADIIQQTLAVCGVLNSHRHGIGHRSETETLLTPSAREPGLGSAVAQSGSELSGTGCVAGVLHEGLGETLGVYAAQRRGLVRPAIALALLEAQAATGGLMEPGKTDRLRVDEAVRRGMVGPELHDALLSAERAVTGYKDPYTGRLVPLFQAMKKQLIVADYATRLLEAQLSTGGIVDPEHRHRLPLEVAYQRGCLDKETQRLLTDPIAGVKGFSDPNTEERLSYRQLLGQCRPGPGPGLLLLPLSQDRPSFRGLRRRVTVEELLEAQVIGADTAEELESGHTTPQEVS
uniref:Uncharacterized protein n=1 Tax=Callorhinchus milii TaxID=7868 RepID=A0A4W3GTS5_CALMI